MKKKRTTINDVALLAGVHKTTVSRALNNPGRISRELSSKIKQAAAELNYIPNRAARTLHLHYTRTIALLIPSFVNNVFNDVIFGVKSITDKAGYSLMIGTSTYSASEEEKIIESYIQQSVDAFILTSTEHTERSVNILKSSNIPVAEIMDMSKSTFDINYGIDHETAAQEMTEHLIRQGNKNIAFCSLKLDPRAQQRKSGWCRALQKYGLNASRVMHVDATASLKIGATLLKDILSLWPEVDAIFFVSDELAAGAVMECHRQSIKVGEDLSICGFNDLDISESIYPEISTVSTPRRQMGQLAAEGLVNILEGVSPDNPIQTLNYELKLRASTGIQ